MQETMYDVVYTRSGKPEFYARGLTLDIAQTIAASLTSAGTIVLARTGSDGYQGGTTTTAAISNVRVVRSSITGTSYQTQKATTTEELVVATNGQTLFNLAHTPLLDTMTVTVAGSSTRPNVIWQLINDQFGTPILLISEPTLTVSIPVSATYNYATAANHVTITGETPTGTPNGSRTTYTTAHVYYPGSVSVTTTVDSVSAISVIEGGGTTFEVLGSGLPLETGTTLTVDYEYSADDDTAIPASETHTETLPTGTGTALHPPYTW